jgi:hypothetical protein
VTDEQTNSKTRKVLILNEFCTASYTNSQNEQLLIRPIKYDLTSMCSTGLSKRWMGFETAIT